MTQQIPFPESLSLSIINFPIIFEPPLNDCVRICLRIEHLVKQLKTSITNGNQSSSRVAIATLLEMLNVIDRPDLKSKLTQSLAQCILSLSQFQQSSQVNKIELEKTLAQLNPLLNKLHGTHNKIADSLRNNDFLNTVRMQLNQPGKACDFSSPVYHLWLKQPDEKRQEHLKNWKKEFDLIIDISQLILDLVRKSATPEKITAFNGFYQRTMNSATPYQMLRVSLPSHLGAYPEISVGKHRLSIHFLIFVFRVSIIFIG